MSCEDNRHQPRPATSRGCVDSNRGVRAFGGILIGAAIVIALPSSSSARADDGKPAPAAPPPKAPAAEKPKAAAAPAGPALFDLRVVGPDDKPIPDAKVNLYTQPTLDKVRLRAGSVLNKPRFGVNLRSDAEGRVVVELPNDLTYYMFQIRKAGYGYYSSWWNAQNQRGAAFAPLTARLPRAWTIGGIVVDGEGQPVANARVTLQVQAAGMGQTAFSDRLWTNSKGIWKFESVPESMTRVVAEVSEPRYMMARPTLERKEFEILAGHEPTGKTALKLGLTVTGKITDEEGKPIPKALVRARFGNDTRNAFTDKSGGYRLEGCERGSGRIVASAKGRAAEFRDVAIGPAPAAVDFRLKPGGTIRVRILDEKGRPVPKATVSIEQWRGNFDYFQFDRAPRDTDVDGVWEWNEAPPGEIIADVGRPQGMTLAERTLSARKEEYVFHVPSELVISGKVVDAETKQPIDKFRAVAGNQWRRAAAQIVWNDNVKVASSPGHYEVHENYEQPAYVMRILADDYLPAVSREIKSDEGNVTVDIELLRRKNAVVTILTPDGAPAVGAKVSLPAANARIAISHGQVQNRGGDADDREADQSGLAHLDSKNDRTWIGVTHRTGFAELAGLSATNPRVIKLTPWAQIDGTFRIASKPEADVQISIFRNVFFFGENVGQVAVQSEQTTDEHGRFVFDQVVPGQYRITTKRTNGTGDSETTSSVTRSLECPAGKTTRVELGTTGRPVTGQLRLPPDSKDLPLASAQIYVRLAGNMNQVAGLNYQAFTATPDRRGNFCIDDVPPGNYFLTAFVPGTSRMRIQAHQFSVTKVSEKLAQRPVDLGVLTLKPWDPARAVKAVK